MTAILALALCGCRAERTAFEIRDRHADAPATRALPGEVAALVGGEVAGGFELGFVLLERAELPPSHRFAHQLAALGAGTVVPGADEGKIYDLSDGARVILALVPAPHPDAGRMPEGPLTPARSAAATAPAHLIVVVSGLAGPALARDVRLARVVAAVASSAPAIGGRLGHGVQFYRPDVLVEAVRGLPDDGVPFEPLIDATMAREGDARRSLLTHGLGRYGREEFLVTMPPDRGGDAYELVVGLGRWVLHDPAKQFPTGDTIGRSEDEKITVQRVPGPLGDGATVIRLDL